jgi:hypothetical protein
MPKFLDVHFLEGLDEETLRRLQSSPIVSLELNMLT